MTTLVYTEYARSLKPNLSKVVGLIDMRSSSHDHLHQLFAHRLSLFPQGPVDEWAGIRRQADELMVAKAGKRVVHIPHG